MDEKPQKPLNEHKPTSRWVIAAAILIWIVAVGTSIYSGESPASVARWAIVSLALVAALHFVGRMIDSLLGVED